jgi:hypothetical protein
VEAVILNEISKGIGKKTAELFVESDWEKGIRKNPLEGSQSIGQSGE